MADNSVIRRGKIIIDLEAGKVELKAPDLDKVLRAKEESLRLSREEAEAVKQNYDDYGERLERVSQLYKQAARDNQQLVEGIARLARGIVLVSGSNKSIEELARSLAVVQGVADILIGSFKTIAALLAASPFVQAAVAIAAIAVAFDALTTSQAEADEAALKYIDTLRTIQNAEAEREDFRRRALQGSQSLAEQIAAAQSQFNRRDFDARDLADKALNDPLFQRNKEIQQASLEFASDMLKGQIGLLDEIVDKERQRTDQLKMQKDEQIEAIQNQQRLVDGAERLLKAEQDKLRSFQSQAGQLAKFEQDQLKAIRDKLKGGQDISSFEEDFLADKGGEGGRNIAEARRARRGAAAGFGDDFFSGIADAGNAAGTGGIARAAEELRKVTEELKKLTGGQGSAEAIAKLQREKDALERQYTEFYEKSAKQIKRLVDVLARVDDKIAELERANLENNRG